jgi:hypothetical protein
VALLIRFSAVLSWARTDLVMYSDRKRNLEGQAGEHASGLGSSAIIWVDSAQTCQVIKCTGADLE